MRDICQIPNVDEVITAPTSGVNTRGRIWNVGRSTAYMPHDLRHLGQSVTVARCDDCRIEQELFKDLIGPPCPHGPSVARRHRVTR